VRFTHQSSKKRFTVVSTIITTKLRMRGTTSITGS